MMHVDDSRGRMYGTLVYCSAFAEAANRPYINVLYVKFPLMYRQSMDSIRLSPIVAQPKAVCLTSVTRLH